MKIRKLGVGLLISALVLGGSVSVFAATDEGKEFVGDIVATITQSTEAIPFDKENLPEGVTFLEKVDMSKVEGFDLSEAVPTTPSEDAVFFDKVELDAEGTIAFGNDNTIGSVVDGKPVE